MTPRPALTWHDVRVTTVDLHPARPADEPSGLPAISLGDPLGTSRLTGRQRAAWATLTAVSLALGARLEAALHREAGLTPFEFHLLHMLQAGDPDRDEGAGEMPMHRAAHLVDASPSRLSHVVRRLEERGWLERRTCPEDARVTLLRLTDEGRCRAAAGLPAYEGIVERLLVDRLGEEDLEELTRLCLALLPGLREGHWVSTALRGEGGAASEGGDDPAYHRGVSSS